MFAVFTLVFCLGVEYAHRTVRAGWERWVWLGCLALCVLPPLWGGGKVWEDHTWLFLHGFAIYYVLNRADALMEGRTSHLLPADGFCGAIVYPFANFFLRFRVLGTFPRRREKTAGRTVFWSVLAILAAAGAFIAAADLLSQADRGFAELIRAPFTIKVHFDLITFFSRLVLSLPVGAYLYGLAVGVGREQQIRERGGKLCAALERMRAVPVKIWIALLAVFALLYGVFFFVQGQYLFGAFTRTLPKDFTVAEYARQGFFELCKVMVLNFALLWLALRSAGESARTHRGLRAAATVILAESLLLAVTAGSKLWLYIDCFGFTPLRLQSAWLIASLSGYGIGTGILQFEMSRDHNTFWAHMFAGAVLIAIGVRMLFIAFRKKTFLEHRMENVDIRADVLLSLHLCLHGFFAGIACGILRLRLPLLLGAVFVISGIFAVGGYITGRTWGVEPSEKAYAIGGGLLCLIGIALQVLQAGV